VVCRLCTAAGVNIFGIAMQVPFGKEMGFGGGIVALAISLKAFINGAGRGVIGWISDRYGRREPLVIVCVVLGLAQYAVYLSGSMGSTPLFLRASMISGFAGRAIFPLFAAMTVDYFGENNIATNYGLVYSSKVISGRVGAAWVRSWRPRGVTAPRSCWPVRSAWGPAESVVVTGSPASSLQRWVAGIWVIAWVRTSIWSAAVFARALPGRSVTASNSVLLSHHTPTGW
jgi:MFS family permease